MGGFPTDYGWGSQFDQKANRQMAGIQLGGEIWIF